MGYRRASAEGEEVIRFAVGEVDSGLVLVARSAVGLRAVLLGDDAGELAEELRGRFPAAQVREDATGLCGLVARVADLIRRPWEALPEPLDPWGTEFQQKVWEALREVPAGQTVSYGDVARRIGQPQAVRAVAGACAANALAVVVPCHRVRRADGGLAGYRWGVEWKRTLLAREAVAAAR